MPYLFKLECGHIIGDYTRTRYMNYRYKNQVKTYCPDCDKLSCILNAGNVRSLSYGM